MEGEEQQEAFILQGREEGGSCMCRAAPQAVPCLPPTRRAAVLPRPAAAASRKVAEEIDVKDLPEDLGKIAVTLLEDPTAAPAATVRQRGLAGAGGLGTGVMGARQGGGEGLHAAGGGGEQRGEAVCLHWAPGWTTGVHCAWLNAVGASRVLSWCVLFSLFPQSCS